MTQERRGDRPRLLDLFCGAGGAAMGYHRAGFTVIGVDHSPQPHYPFLWFECDALDFLRGLTQGVQVFGRYLEEFDVIHASPPCQAYTTLKGLTTRQYPKLIPELRALLIKTGKPWIIENVAGAALLNPIQLCGSSFGLGVRRHRLFELSDPFALVPFCAHHLQPLPLDVTGTGGPSKKPRTAPGGGLSRKPGNLLEAREAMGIDWMNRADLSQAIPPAYTEWIGRQIIHAEGKVTHG